MTVHTSNAASARQPGRLSRALIRLLMKHAQVVESESIAEGFRLITLESPEFKALQWMPGQKMQITMGAAFVARTFTPIEWNAATGRTRILGYIHGNGPGSAWVRDARQGTECDVFGPRASLDVRDVPGARVLLGDETSIGLACAIGHDALGGSLQCLLEVNDAADAREAILRLGLERIDLFRRMQNDAHLEAMEHRLPALAAAGATFVLTGKATSIQYLRRALKALGVPAARLVTKPYWALGKTGLD